MSVVTKHELAGAALADPAPTVDVKDLVEPHHCDILNHQGRRSVQAIQLFGDTDPDDGGRYRRVLAPMRLHNVLALADLLAQCREIPELGVLGTD